MRQNEPFILDGKACAKQWRQKIEAEVKQAIAGGRRAPGLAVIQVGDDPASTLYIRNKQRACAQVGIHFDHYHLPEAVGQPALLSLIETLNDAERVDGILCQLPLPKGYSVPEVQAAVDPQKDVDGVHPLNQGELLAGRMTGLKPCTPTGILHLLHEAQFDLEGRVGLVIGRSSIVGKPLAQMLLQANMTLIQVHSKSKELQTLSRHADFIFAAAGVPHLVQADWIKPGAVLIDVGIHKTETGWCGDIDPKAYPLARAYTPVPGGVGPLTIAGLLANCLTAYQRREGLSVEKD